MIEEYLNEVCYNWKALSEYSQDGIRYVEVKELTPNGDTYYYTLHEKNGEVLNKHGDKVNEPSE